VWIVYGFFIVVSVVFLVWNGLRVVWVAMFRFVLVIVGCWLFSDLMYVVVLVLVWWLNISRFDSELLSSWFELCMLLVILFVANRLGIMVVVVLVFIFILFIM